MMCTLVIHSKVYGAATKIKLPKKVSTPYGGRLEWDLPSLNSYQLSGKTRLFVHLKDKTLIRARKRWSQVILFAEIAYSTQDFLRRILSQFFNCKRPIKFCALKNLTEVVKGCDCRTTLTSEAHQNDAFNK